MWTPSGGLLGRAVAGAALMVGVLGTIVLVGWYARIPILTRGLPEFVSMQFNTALLLVLSALALHAALTGVPRRAALLGVGVLAIAGLTLLEHLTGRTVGIDLILWTLGVDQRSMHHYTEYRQSAPGRMAPITAFCGTLAGLSFVVLSARVTRLTMTAACVMGLVIASLGTVAFSGYLYSVPSEFGWGHLTRMSIITASAVAVLGSALVSMSLLSAMRAGLPVRRWMPAIAGVSVAVVTLMMWQALADNDRHNTMTAVEQKADDMAGEIARRGGDRVHVIQRLAERWRDTGAPPRAAWEYTAAQLVGDYPGFRGIGWADAAGVVQWLAPVSTGSGTRWESDVVGRWGSVLHRSIALGRPQATPPVRLDDGTLGTLIVASIVRRGALEGYVVGMVSYPALVSDALGTEQTTGFGFRLIDGTFTPYADRHGTHSDVLHWGVRREVLLGGRFLQLEVVPTRDLLSASSSGVPLAFLLLGLSSAVLAAWLARGAQVKREQSRRLARLVNDLAVENEARRDAEILRDEHAEELMSQSEELEQQNAQLHENTLVLEQQRDEMERAQEFRAALVRSTVDAVAAFGNEGFVTAWNPAMERLTGRDATDAVGQRIAGHLRFLPDDREARLLVDAMAGRPTHLVDVRTADASGDEQWLDVTVTPMIAQDGELLGGLLVARDVTVRKKVADVIVAAKNGAEAANRAKSDFLARMSHELRTPLNSVIGFTNVLKRNRTRRLEPDELTYLDRIGANGRHLLSLINEVLDLSKIEAGHETVEIVEAQIAAMVTDTVAELDVRATDAGVRLHVELPASLGATATDPAKLKQVLINLVGNALKFTPEGGWVTVRVVAIGGRPARIEVQDSGIGIPEDRLAAIFEAFEQADADTSRRFGGTGLGLAISRKLCTLMRHELLVRSTVGQGSVFTIVLGGTEGARAAA